MNRVHFIGMGGIGMSALARVWMQRGAAAQGSDLAASALLEELQREGAQIVIGHRREAIANAEMVVYSTDIKEENEELAAAREQKLPVFHRSEFLDFLMRGKKPLLVTGTHGKTTTTSLLAHVLVEAKWDPSFVIGGIHKNHATNGKNGSGAYFVAEADESDGSFLRTKAFGAIVTNLEDEHLNHWKNSEKLDEAFAQFCDRVERSDLLFWCGDDPRLCDLSPRGVSYGFAAQDLRIVRWSRTETGLSFDLEWKEMKWSGVDLSLYGKHNALNGAAVFGLCLSLGVEEEAIRRAFSTFAGSKRRLEWKGALHGVDLYDDYGHHPTEIAAALSALRDRVRERRLVAVFQPHRYSRVKDLFDQFAGSFAAADLVLMTDIYAAGEAPLEGATTALLYAKMRGLLGPKLYYFPRSHLEEAAAELLMPHDALLTIGAGDVTKAGEPILQRYAQRAPKWAVALLFGGTSAEHDVSLMSAKRILSSLDKSLYDVQLFGVTKNGEWVHGEGALEKLEQKISFSSGTAPIDATVWNALMRCHVAIPAFHGPQGEDGMFQGFLETLNIPYAGCDYRTGSLCMNKVWTKHIAALCGVPTASYFELEKQTFLHQPERLLDEIDQVLSYPVWIKPVHLGSSIGVSRAQNREEAIEAARLAFYYDDSIIVEREVRGIQVEYALLGNEYLRIAKSCEILNLGFHDYESKYGKNASGMAIPARMDAGCEEIGASLARAMYRAAGCKGLARIDFFLDEEGYFWMNEINPFPGFTNTSAYPSMWQESGMSLKELCSEMVILAFHRHRRLLEIRGK